MKTMKTNKSIFMGIALLMGVLLLNSCDWDGWRLTPSNTPPLFLIVKFADSTNYSENVPCDIGYTSMRNYDCFWDSLQSAPIGHRTYPLEGGYYLSYNTQWRDYDVTVGYYTLTWKEFRERMLETFKEYPNATVGIRGEEILVIDPFEEVYICEDVSAYEFTSLAFARSDFPTDYTAPYPIWGNLATRPLEYPLSEGNCQFFCDCYRIPDPEMIEKLNDLIRKGELNKTFKRVK